jgi:hypothetical protein
MAVSRMLLATGGPHEEICDRKAISSAYYALFNLFGSEAVDLVKLVVGDELVQRAPGDFSRSIAHDDVKTAAQVFCKGSGDRVQIPFFGEVTIPRDLKTVLTTFTEVQDERHTADYNFKLTYSHRIAQEIVERVDEAVRLWSTVRHEPAARLFLLMLIAGLSKERTEKTKAVAIIASASAPPPSAPPSPPPPPPPPTPPSR